MENTPTIERLGRLLDLEQASEGLTQIPADTYTRLAGYAQKLRVSTGSADDLSGRLAKKQLWLIEAMTKRLLEVRVGKALSLLEGGDSGPSSSNLLPEERYANQDLDQSGRKEDRLVRAVVDGQPSFFTALQRREMQRMTTIRMSKRVGEIMGADLKRYGPFEVNDVARVPAANARAMIAGNQAVQVSTDEF